MCLIELIASFNLIANTLHSGEDDRKKRGCRIFYKNTLSHFKSSNVVLTTSSWRLDREVEDGQHCGTDYLHAQS